MLTLVIGIIVIIFFVLLNHDSTRIIEGTIGLILTLVVLLLLIPGTEVGKTTSYENIILVNGYYINSNGNVITDKDTRKNIQFPTTLTKDNVTNAPYLKIVKTDRIKNIWTFNHGSSYSYSIVFEKDN